MAVMEANDQNAVRAVLGGDPEAYRELVVRHSGMLLRVAQRITGNAADADEVVQEALMRGFRKLGTVEAEAGFGSWIYRIGVNCAYDLLARRKRDAGYLDSGTDEDGGALQIAEPGAGPERLLLSGEMRARQELAMGSLTALERTAFVMRHIEERSTAEIGEALEIGPNAAKQAVFRAVQKLRQRLAPLREVR